MALKNINPTKTDAWKLLRKHHEELKAIHLRNMFLNDKEREHNFLIQLNDLKVDFSRNKINEKTISLLLQLANEVSLNDAIEKYFSGDIINVTEQRAVLHTALRSSSEEPIYVNGKDIKPQIQTTLRKIRAFSNKVISGKWKGFSGKTITDIVNIGVGGSELGVDFVSESLQFYKNHLNIHFISNIDGDSVFETLKKLNPETTLFVIVSKSFTTQETMTNANTVRNWFLKSASIFDVAKHFVAVSANLKETEKFGIDKKNVFPMWDWVGGRFSLWSAVGLTICLSIGFNNYKELLAGAEEMDIHFRDEEFSKNIPVILALLSIWYNNFFGYESEGVLSYTQYLKKIIPFLQQVTMESNGKGVDRDGNTIDYQTGTILFGGTGTNIQHEFMQLVHQGTKVIPVDFIGFESSLNGLEEHHEKLMANYYAQIDALAFGKTKEQVHLELKTTCGLEKVSQLLPFKIFEGNKPSTNIVSSKLTPKTLGRLIAMYEHKVFVQGVIWNIYSFDQFGVELGKEIANKILNKK